MKERVKEIREAKKSGKDPNGPSFTPVQYMQKLGDVKTELETGSVRDTLLTKAGVNTPEAQTAFKIALNWILHFDEGSIAAQLAKHEEREAKRKVEADKRKLEREAKKGQEAAAKAADVAAW